MNTIGFQILTQMSQTTRNKYLLYDSIVVLLKKCIKQYIAVPLKTVNQAFGLSH